MMNTANNYVELPSGLILTEEAARERARPKAIDIFAGAGGMSLGLMQAGFDVVAAVDHWAVAAMTYMTNLGSFPCKFHFATDDDFEAMERELQKQLKRDTKNGIAVMPVSGSGWISHHPETAGVGHFFLGDVKKMTGKKILDVVGLAKGEVDLVAGGPPCQGFSRGGKQNVMDPRNSLVFDFARLICEIQPKMMVMENVPGIIDMVTPDGVPVVDAFCRILEDGGFGGLDAFLKSVKAQTGAVGLLKGRKKKRPVKDKDVNHGQLGLFTNDVEKAVNS